MLKVAWVSTAAGFWKLTGPGPLSSVQLLVVAAGGLGRPSSLTVASSAAAAGSVTVRSGPALTTGATFMGGGPVVYSMWRRGALAGFPDRESTRLDSRHPVISYAVFFLEKKNT